jgi:hypothetical protein
MIEDMEHLGPGGRALHYGALWWLCRELERENALLQARLAELERENTRLREERDPREHGPVTPEELDGAK